LPLDRRPDIAPLPSSPALVMGWALHLAIPSTMNLWPAAVIKPSNDASK
jgi:hypothetical protein